MQRHREASGGINAQACIAHTGARLPNETRELARGVAVVAASSDGRIESSNDAADLPPPTGLYDSGVWDRFHAHFDAAVARGEAVPQPDDA